MFDRLGNSVKLPDGRRFSPRQDQPLEYALGKKWKTRFTTTTEKRGSSASEFEFRIVGRERVAVPAGSFDCFVIEGDRWSTTERRIRVRLGSKRWMAPEEVRRPIASEQFRRIEGRAIETPKKFWKAGTFLTNERLELAEFKQS